MMRRKKNVLDAFVTNAACLARCRASARSRARRDRCGTEDVGRSTGNAAIFGKSWKYSALPFFALSPYQRGANGSKR
jgi:hypothetical protein